jgi:hypothetical protein
MKASLALLLAPLLACAATPAAALDCAALKTTNVPFAVDYAVKRVPTGGEVITSREQSQITRKPGETVAYTVSGPGRWIRVRSVSPLLPLDSFISQPPTLRTWTYSIDPKVDWLARRKDIEFDAEQREEGGKLFLKAHMKFAFTGTTNVELAGCKFEAVRLVRTHEGTAGGRPLSSRVEVWTSPELRAALFTRITDPNFTMTWTPTGIALEFTPAE